MGLLEKQHEKHRVIFYSFSLCHRVLVSKIFLDFFRLLDNDIQFIFNNRS